MEISIPFGGGRNCLRKLQIWSNYASRLKHPQILSWKSFWPSVLWWKAGCFHYVSTNSWNSRHKRLVCVCACPYTVYVCFLSFALFLCWSFVENSCRPFYPRAISNLIPPRQSPEKPRNSLYNKIRLKALSLRSSTACKFSFTNLTGKQHCFFLLGVAKRAFPQNQMAVWE